MIVTEQMNAAIHQMFFEFVLVALLGSAFLEKGISILQERHYSGRKAFAYLLIMFGIRKLSSMIFIPGG